MRPLINKKSFNSSQTTPNKNTLLSEQNLRLTSKKVFQQTLRRQKVVAHTNRFVDKKGLCILSQKPPFFSKKHSSHSVPSHHTKNIFHHKLTQNSAICANYLSHFYTQNYRIRKKAKNLKIISTDVGSTTK